MCTTSRPKTPPPASQQPQKPPVYMRNAFLDGLGINGETAGRNSLRIDMGSRAARPPTTPPPTSVRPPNYTPPPSGPLGGRDTGGGFRNNFGLGIQLR